MNETRSTLLRPALGYLAIAVCFVALFARTASYDLVWDDEGIAPSQARFAHLLDGLRSSQQNQMADVQSRTKGFELPYDSYRPLLFASYRLDRMAFGLAPGPMHLHNLAIGLINVLLLAALLRRFELGDGLGLTLTAAFALHPVQIETVSYVSARGDLLAAGFALLALLALVASAQRLGRARYVAAALSGLCLLLSLFSKETYVGLPLAVALFAFTLGRLRATVPSIAAMLAFIGLYGVIRLSHLGADGAHLGRESPWQLLLQWPAIAGQSVQAIAVPIDISINRPAAFDLLVFGILMLVAGAAVALARERFASRPAALAGGAVLALYALLGPVAVPVSSTGILSDRYLYAAVPLVVLPAALLVRECAARPRVRALAWGASALWAMACALVWPSSAAAWRDERSLYRRAVAVAPDRTESWYYLGRDHAERGEWAQAAMMLEHSIDLDPLNQRARNNLGVVRLNQGQLQKALEQFDVTLRLTGGLHYRACYNKGMTLLRLERGEQACEHLRACAVTNPAYENTRKALRQFCSPPAP